MVQTYILLHVTYDLATSMTLTFIAGLLKPYCRHNETDMCVKYFHNQITDSVNGADRK